MFSYISNNCPPGQYVTLMAMCPFVSREGKFMFSRKEN